MALKYLKANRAEQALHREAFIAEAQMMGQLQHPNILPVHQLGVSEEGVPYFTMKLVYGETLQEWLEFSSPPVGSSQRLSESLEIFMKVCDAVSYAHHRGVIHRDLKPANIMVGDFGQVYLMDWGIARLPSSDSSPTQPRYMKTKGVTGTPHYMAPEQAHGNPEDTDERTDVFGLGAILYELLCGQCPYGNDPDPRAILEHAKAGKVVSLEKVLGSIYVSPRLRQITHKTLLQNKTDRYQTVAELKEAIAHFVRGGLHLPRCVYPPGATIVSEGDVGDSAFLIMSGTCRAFRDLDGEREDLSVMKQGDFFGELALVLDEPRSASVEAIDEVTVLILDRSTMEEGFAVDGWTGALIRALAQRFRNLEKEVRRP
jgi:eukaryotic-like serine/threonine-protein kinase